MTDLAHARLDVEGNDYRAVVIYEVVDGIVPEDFDQLKAVQPEDATTFMERMQDADLVVTVSSGSPYVIKDRFGVTRPITRKELLAVQRHDSAVVIRV